MSTTTTSLNHLTGFVDKHVTFGNIEASFRSGWKQVMTTYFKQKLGNKPGVYVFPADELTIESIDPIPLSARQSMKPEKWIISTAWVRGLTFRLYYLDYQDGDMKPILLLKCVKRHHAMNADVTKFPSALAIDHTLLVHSTNPSAAQLVNTTDKSKYDERGAFLIDLIEEITSGKGKFKFFKDKIHVHQKLKHQYVLINLGRSWSLCEILDTVCHYLDAIWDWSDKETIAIIPCPGCKPPTYSIAKPAELLEEK